MKIGKLQLFLDNLDPRIFINNLLDNEMPRNKVMPQQWIRRKTILKIKDLEVKRFENKTCKTKQSC